MELWHVNCSFALSVVNEFQLFVLILSCCFIEIVANINVSIDHENAGNVIIIKSNESILFPVCLIAHCFFIFNQLTEFRDFFLFRFRLESTDLNSSIKLF